GGDDKVHAEGDKLSHERRQPIALLIREPPLDEEILALDVAKILQAVREGRLCFDLACAPQHPDPRHLRRRRWLPRRPPTPRQQPQPSRTQRERPAAQTTPAALHRRLLLGRHHPIGARRCQLRSRDMRYGANASYPSSATARASQKVMSI